MMIHDITQKAGKHKSRKRLGRGVGSGLGKTSGRGHKGRHSRSGFSRKIGHEGGQTPFFMRIRKVGFSNFQFAKHYAIVNLGAIAARFDDGAEVNPALLVKHGLIRDLKLPVKVLAEGDLRGKKFNIHAQKFSAAAKAKLESVGGTASEG